MSKLSEVHKSTMDVPVQEYKKIVNNFDPNKFEVGFMVSRKQLKWPLEESSRRNTATKFIQAIKRVMSKRT